MTTEKCKEYLTTNTPEEGQKAQAQAPSINIDQLCDDVAFASTLLTDTPEDVLQTDDRGNVYPAPHPTLNTQQGAWFNGDKPRRPKIMELLHEMQERFNLCKIDGEVALYDVENNRYCRGRKMFDSMLTRFVYEDASDYICKEVYKKACLPGILDERTEAPTHYLQFKNCIVNAETGERYALNPAFYITAAYFPINFNPDAYDENVDKFLSKVACGRPEIIENLHQCMAFIIHPASSYHVYFYNTARTHNASGGKSTCATLFSHLLTGTKSRFEDKFTTVKARSLASEFNKLNLRYSMYNLSDESAQPNSKVEREAVNAFMKEALLNPGAGVTGEEKNVQGAVDFLPRFIWVDCCNELDRITWDDGVDRRTFFIPFNAHITSDDPDFDPFILSKLNTEEAIQTMMNYALAALQKMHQTKKFEFTDTEDNRRAKAAAKTSSTNLLSWMKELNLSEAVLTYRGKLRPFIYADPYLKTQLVKYFGERSNIDDNTPRYMSSKDWYYYFKVWCEVNGKQASSKWEEMLQNELHLFLHPGTKLENGKRWTMIAFKDDDGNPQHSAEIFDQYKNKIRPENIVNDYLELCGEGYKQNEGFLPYGVAAKIREQLTAAGYIVPPFNDDEKDLPPVMDGTSADDIVTNKTAADMPAA